MPIWIKMQKEVQRMYKWSYIGGLLNIVLDKEGGLWFKKVENHCYRDIFSCGLIPCPVNSEHVGDWIYFQPKSLHPLLWWLAPLVVLAKTTWAWRAPQDLSRCTTSPMHLHGSSALSERQQKQLKVNIWGCVIEVQDMKLKFWDPIRPKIL